MIPILYPWSETEFQTEGLGRLTEITDISVTQNRNREFECEFKYPINGRLFDKIEIGSIIYTTHDVTETPQPFQVYRRSAPLQGVVTFYAEHLSYRLRKIVVAPFTAGSATEAMAKMRTYSVNSNPFTFWTDKETTGNFRVKAPVAIRNALGGMAGSVLDVFGGGDFEWDKWTVRLYNHKGNETNATIRYAKNLTQLKHELKGADTYNAVAPFWSDSESGVTVVLPEGCIPFDNAPASAQTLVNEAREHITANGEDIEVNAYRIDAVPLDLSDEFDDQPTVEQLRAKAVSAMRNKSPWAPKENITVSFANLWETPEYASIAPLERCTLCDTVNVFYETLNITGKARIISTTWNPLISRYTEMELGEPKQTLGEMIQAKIEADIIEKVPTVTSMQAAIDAATKLITGGFGGYVHWEYLSDGTPSELYFLDQPSMEAAVNILRINKNGIGFSSDGGTTYKTAWTLDGSFVADFITAGTINANLLKAGIITDKKGLNYWNLETGEISIRYDVDPEGGVTQADLQRVEQNAKDYADSAVADGIDGLATEEYVTGAISASRQGIETEFSDTFVTKPNAIVQSQYWWYLSTSPTQLFGGQWSTTPPTREEQDRYVWQFTRNYYADGHYTDSAPVCISGNDGSAGQEVLYLYITSNGSTATAKETPATVTLTGCVGRGAEIDTDPNGTKYHYAWYMQKDKEDECFYDSGKNVPLTISGNLFEDRAQMRFTLVDADFFQLVTHNGTALTNAGGEELEVG